MLENKELNDAIRDSKTVNRAIYGCFLPDIDMLHSVVSELMKLPFHLFENGVSFTGESPIVLEFIAAASKSKLLPKQKKLSNIRYLNNIFDLVGLNAACIKQSRDENGDRKREYQLRDALCYYEVDEKGNVVRTIMLEPLLEQCLDIRRDKLLGKYDSAHFDEKNKALVSEEKPFEPTKIGGKHKIRQPTLCLNSQLTKFTRDNDELEPLESSQELDNPLPEFKKWDYIDLKDGRIYCQFLEIVGDIIKANLPGKIISFCTDEIQLIRRKIGGKYPVIWQTQ